MTGPAAGAEPAEPIVQRWLIGGRVQGVGYRMWFEAEARALGVTGWVRNLADGRVEAAVRGPAEALRRLAAAAQHGPRLASVDRVQVLPWQGPIGQAHVEQRATAALPEPD